MNSGPGGVVTTAQRGFIAAGAALVVASGAASAAGAPDVVRFAISGLAMAALAALVGQALDQMGSCLRPGSTGLLQATLGNLPELLFSIFALRAGLVGVVEAALIGSVLGNLLLVLGVAFAFGAARHGTQSFEPEAPRMSLSLMVLAVASMAVPTLAVRLNTPVARHAGAVSDVAAVVLLVVYLASIPFWLLSGPARSGGRPGRPAEGAASGYKAKASAATQGDHRLPLGQGRQRPNWPLVLPLAVLIAASGASALVSKWFVAALEPATRSLGISPVFTGLVIVAVASNAVEHAAGVWLAWKARPDYALSTILNSPLQIALVLTPVLVLASPALGPAPLVLVFKPMLVAALAIATLAVTIVIYDGEYSWLEGVSLVALYVVIASAFWWG